MTNITEREQWFLNRIGKRVYVNKPIHSCEKCQKAFNQGYLITDARAAIDLAETEELYAAEGTFIKFFDTKEEALS